MKPTLASLIISLLLTSTATCQVIQGQNPAPSKPISVDELVVRPVIGRLGVPLGTATMIEAKVVAGRTLRTKADDGKYLLSVTHVAGRKLPRPTLMRFGRAIGSRSIMASDRFELYRVKTGRRAGSLDSKQVAELEKGYVGSRVRLLVFESGSFSGIPAGLPASYPVWAGTGFGFSTSLSVLEDRK